MQFIRAWGYNKNKMNKNESDPFMKLIGQFGRWQLKLLFCILLVKFSSSCVQMSIVFLTPKYTFWCSEFIDDSTSAISVSNGSCYDDCLRYDYDTSPMKNTLVSEWDLVCHRHWMASFTQTMLQFGLVVGSIAFGFFSDRIGRKKSFLVAIVILVLTGFGVPFSVSYEMFTSLRFILGIALGGINSIAFVFAVEAIGPNYREAMSGIFHFPFVFGYASIALIAYYLRTWQHYTLGLAFPPLLFLTTFFILTESPRWLISVGKLEEANQLVKKIAKMNYLPTAKIEESVNVLYQEIRNSEDTKFNYFDLFKDPYLRKLTICSCILWVVSGLSFYGLNQYINQTSSNLYVSVVAAAFIQLPSYVLSIYLVKYLGRKRTTIIFSILGGMFVLILGYVPQIFWLTLTLGSLGVSCSSIVASAIYIYSSELFPTVVRNMGMGLMSMSMRIGSMIAPFVSNLSVTVPWLPTLILGLSPILSVAVCFLLPETKGRKLPDSIEELGSK